MKTDRHSKGFRKWRRHDVNRYVLWIQACEDVCVSLVQLYWKCKMGLFFKWHLRRFTLTVLRSAETDQRGRNVGLASTAGWTWKCKEEERLSESEAVRVGESECLRGATTMRVGETVRLWEWCLEGGGGCDCEDGWEWEWELEDERGGRLSLREIESEIRLGFGE